MTGLHENDEIYVTIISRQTKTRNNNKNFNKETEEFILTTKKKHRSL